MRVQKGKRRLPTVCGGLSSLLFLREWPLRLHKNTATRGPVCTPHSLEEGAVVKIVPSRNEIVPGGEHVFRVEPQLRRER